MGARGIIEQWRNRPRGRVSPVVIGEIPETILPPGAGTVAPTGPSGPLSVPKGWETVVIQGEERVVVPDVYRGPSPVLEPLDPSVVIGEVQGADTAAQSDDNGGEVAHDWGHLFRETVGGLIGISDPSAQLYNPGYTQQFTNLPPQAGGGAVMPTGTADCQPCGPRYLTYDCKTGKFSSRKRRRRRRLITPTDLGDLASIVAITGKGAGMNQAIAQAVRR